MEERKRDLPAPIEMTREAWTKTHRDFKAVVDGQRYVLRMTGHGTALVPVTLTKETKL